MRYQNIVHCLRQINTPESIIHDVEEIYKSLKEENKKMQDELFTAREEIVQKDYRLENQKSAIEDAVKLLESMKSQNRYMKALLVEEWRGIE